MKLAEFRGLIKLKDHFALKSPSLIFNFLVFLKLLYMITKKCIIIIILFLFLFFLKKCFLYKNKINLKHEAHQAPRRCAAI